MTDHEPFPLSRPVEVATIRADGLVLHIDADEAERVARGVGESALVRTAMQKLQATAVTEKMIPRGSIVGTSVADPAALKALPLKQLEAAFAQTLAGRFPDTGQTFVYQRRDGSRFPALHYLAPMRQDGSISGWVANVIDLSVQEAQREPVPLQYLDESPSYMFLAT